MPEGRERERCGENERVKLGEGGWLCEGGCVDGEGRDGRFY